MSISKRNILYWLIVLAVLGFVSFYLYADIISVTAPPWDLCGFRETKAGTAFVCIQYDVEPFRLK